MHIAIFVQVGALELCISQFLYRWVLYASIWYKRELEVCRLEGVEASVPFSLHASHKRY